MLVAPVQWIVQAVSLLPPALRPGVFLTILLAILWLLLVQRIAPQLWHLACRMVARILTAAVALLLFCEYLLTRARRRRGGQPKDFTLLFGDAAENVADWAVAFHGRHQASKVVWKRFPWKQSVLLIVVLAGLWVAMDKISPTDAAKRQLASGFEVWRKVEAWAHVDLARRAAPGVPVVDTEVQVRRLGHRGRNLPVRLRCLSAEGCRDEVVAETASGRALVSIPMTLTAGQATLVQLKMPPDAPRRLRNVRVFVYET